MRLSFFLALSMLLASAPAAVAEDVNRLLERVDDLMRGDSSQGRMTMRVKTKRFEREMTLESWSKGSEKSLIRILEPVKERGTATLKVGDKIWNYLPKIDRTIKVPGSMMSGSWMGSHFTNDDLVQESRYSEDFDCTLAGDEEDWSVTCIPHEDAPVVWGRVLLVLSKSDELPREARFFDEDGELIRTMLYDDVRSVGSRKFPTRLRAIPADEPGEFTEIVYADLEFDVDLDDRLFSLQSLKR
ncbi:MAG: outer membrane lipoprotein-sorting protein [Acidobacteriota bacterium]